MGADGGSRKTSHGDDSNNRYHKKGKRRAIPYGGAAGVSVPKISHFNNIIADGGRGGIRTHGTVSRTPVFKTGSLNHSDTLPSY